MKITTKFDTGDVVYQIKQRPTQTWIPCAACGAKGRITLEDKTTTTCPKCFGREGETKYGKSEWQLAEDLPRLTIGQVRVEITDSPGIEGEERFENYKAQSSHKESYMCIETGIGSGTIHRGTELFLSKAFALAECELRNASMSEAKESD